MSSPGDDSPSDVRSRTADDDRGPAGVSDDRSGDENDRYGVRDRVETFFTTDDGPIMVVREMATSAGGVLLIGLLLFAVSGIWPPMVAVESGSMEPHMQKGDLVFIMEEHRFPNEASHGNTGVTTYAAGQKSGYESFGNHGDVIIYRAYGGDGTPIIHRARFWVDKGENWYDKADKDYVQADSCAEMDNCPAPHAGFITKGDANSYYDQVERISSPVKPSWITGTAELRIPWLGWIRLKFAQLAAVMNTPAATDAGTAVEPMAETSVNELAAMNESDRPSLRVERAVSDGEIPPASASQSGAQTRTATA